VLNGAEAGLNSDNTTRVLHRGKPETHNTEAAETAGYCWLPLVTAGYSWLQLITADYRCLPLVTAGYCWLLLNLKLLRKCVHIHFAQDQCT